MGVSAPEGRRAADHRRGDLFCHRGGGCLHRVAGQMCISCRGGRLRVPEDFADDRQSQSTGRRDACKCVPQVVQADVVAPGYGADRLPGLFKVDQRCTSPMSHDDISSTFRNSRGEAASLDESVQQGERNCHGLDQLPGDGTIRRGPKRAAAMATLKPGSGLRYQAAVSGRTEAVACWTRAVAQSAIMENRPSGTGVVRRIARSDHWRWVSTSRCARTSWQVVSTRQRETNQRRMAPGPASGSVQRTALGSVNLVLSLGNALPVSGGRTGAGSNRLASSRNRVTTQTWRRTAASRSSAAKPTRATPLPHAAKKVVDGGTSC